MYETMQLSQLEVDGMLLTSSGWHQGCYSTSYSAQMTPHREGSSQMWTGLRERPWQNQTAPSGNKSARGSQFPGVM